MPNEPKNILEKYEISPNKVLGQNFLIQKRYILDLIAVAEISKDDTVVEVGPGTGEITKELAKKAKRVLAVEKDPGMVKILRDELREFDNVEIVQEDILKFSIINFQLPNYKLVGAIPYYLTGRLFRKFLENTKNPPKTMAVIIQEGIAEKIVARPPKSNLLAISIQLYGEAVLEKRVPKDAFWPKPNVNSAILTVNNVKKPKINEKEFFRILKAGFSSPRKQMARNFARELKISLSNAQNLLKKAGVNPSARAGTLKLEDWLRLTNFLRKYE